MTREEQIKQNAERGYLHVAEFDGYDIWKQKNVAGGWTYYCDKIGYEGAFVLWDTALYGKEDLLAILTDIAPELMAPHMNYKVHEQNNIYRQALVTIKNYVSTGGSSAAWSEVQMKNIAAKALE